MEFNAIKYFKNKTSVLVVGNAKIKKEKNLKKYDCIVRINLGAQEAPINIWVNNLTHGSLKSLKEYPEVDGIMRLNAEREGFFLKRAPSQILNKSYFWNSLDYQKMRTENGFNKKGHNPTAGFDIIYWLLNYTDCRITITGFDFFKTPNMYNKKVYDKTNKFFPSIHDIELEQKIIEKWSDTKLITIN